MLTIAIPQLYCGASGQKGAYNRQEVGLARAFAALGCRAVVLYPDVQAAAPRVETPEPGIKIYYCPARALGVLYRAYRRAHRPRREFPDHRERAGGLWKEDRGCRRHSR